MLSASVNPYLLLVWLLSFVHLFLSLFEKQVAVVFACVCLAVSVHVCRCVLRCALCQCYSVVVWVVLCRCVCVCCVKVRLFDLSGET